MRLVAALMKHETNTFSPVPTPLARFCVNADKPYEGKAAYDAYKGTGSALAAYIDLAEQAGAELVTPIAANAFPSGPVSSQAFEYISDVICTAVARGCDGILLDLHGAMVTDTVEDGEGTLLARLRSVAPDVPIAVAFDMHANVFPAMVDSATTIAGYQTYPHVDHYETGMRAGRTVLRKLRGELTPTMVWGNLPMLPHIMRQGTADSPNREIQARAKAMEHRGEALIASVFTGFPHADVSNAGLSAVVVTDSDEAAARRLQDELLAMAWESRRAFVYELEALSSSLERAKWLSLQQTDKPVILLDHYDNCGSGGTMDTTAVLEGVLRAGFEDVAVFAIFDPAAVQKLKGVGVGNRATLRIGGNIDMPSIGRKGQPVEVSGTVKLISDGKYCNRGPMESGVLINMGDTVVLDTGNTEIVIISRQVEPYDTECLASLGIDPRKKRFLVLKSRIHYRATFAELAGAIVECAGVGVCTSDYGQLKFAKVRRPIYPLDLYAFGRSPI
jgi:microcystin degradation protein MlrC